MEAEGNKEESRKGNAFFRRKNEGKLISCYFVRKPKMASEAR